MNERPMVKVVDGKRYNTETATLIADDVYFDGHNMERGGRNTWLYRTTKGAYFTVTRSQWQGEQDILTPVSEDRARELFEGQLTEHEMSYEEAFPNFNVEDA